MNKLREMENYFCTWLERFKQASKAAPIVQETYEEIAWARRAMDARPPEAANLSIAQIDQSVDAAHENMTTLLPQIPDFSSNNVIQISGLATSANTAVTEYIRNVGELGTPAATKWSTEQVATYKTLQEQHTRPARVRDLLANRWPQVIDRFDAAVTAYRQCAINTGNDAAAALEMRTALDAVQGELFAEAKSNRSENMTWDIMATRLGAKDAVRRKNLVNQASIRRTLYEQLSDVAKRRPGHHPSIDALWTMWLDHLFVVLI